MPRLNPGRRGLAGQVVPAHLPVRRAEPDRHLGHEARRPRAIPGRVPADLDPRAGGLGLRAPAPAGDRGRQVLPDPRMNHEHPRHGWGLYYMLTGRKHSRPDLDAPPTPERLPRPRRLVSRLAAGPGASRRPLPCRAGTGSTTCRTTTPASGPGSSAGVQPWLVIADGRADRLGASPGGSGRSLRRPARGPRGPAPGLDRGPRAWGEAGADV